jgi:hypothetical protein
MRQNEGGTATLVKVPGTGGEETGVTLDRVRIPDYVSFGDEIWDVKKIGDWVFESAESLKNVKLPKELTSIGKGAFDGCDSLKYIVIPEGVNFIDDYAFAKCPLLSTIIYLGTTQPKIGEEAFNSQCFDRVLWLPNASGGFDDVRWEADKIEYGTKPGNIEIE